ncbi:CheW domain protein [Salinarchaeum sp. Harcht-Bsk1]|uniref:chemotaxis protein CheW n=1 Tax=Salinarchaeum sp. Harcht-Bsk1 TaxID=1333523 RepID=UPI00034233CA|nr:chemotaxis protein CheW [Salinarchaeum sp. Harcht-Bsk1]AGN00007.1 CheW domain protein [Salinarchaeum sp. Harcht-Bsk1]
MELPEELIGIEEELDIDETAEPDVALGETEAEGQRQEEEEEREQFVRFSLGDQSYALHVNAVRRLVDVGERTRVPRTSEAIDGITDLRGEITAVIDPRVLFGLPESERSVDVQELIVFATGSNQGNAGIRVDVVDGVEAIPVSHVVLEPEDVSTDAEMVSQRLEEPLVAGLIREDDGEGGFEYTPVVDVDAMLDVARKVTV